MKRIIAVAVLAMSSMTAQAFTPDCSAVYEVAGAMITAKADVDPANEIPLSKHTREAVEGYVDVMSGFIGTENWNKAEALIDAAEWLSDHADTYQEVYEFKLTSGTDELPAEVAQSMYNKCFMAKAGE